MCVCVCMVYVCSTLILSFTLYRQIFGVILPFRNGSQMEGHKSKDRKKIL